MLSWLKIRTCWAGLLTILLLQACNSDSPTAKRMNFELKGTLKNAPSTYVVLSEMTAEGLILLDSAKTNESGDFQMSASIPENLFCNLRIGRMGYIQFIAEKNKSLEITADMNNLRNYQVRNSEASRQLKVFLDLNEKELAKMDTLRKHYGHLNPDSISREMYDRIHAEIQEVKREQRAMMENFIRVNEGTIATYYPLGFIIRDPSPELVKTCLDKMQRVAPESKYTLYLRESLEKGKIAGRKTPAPGFELRSLADSNVQLEAFRGKNLYISFWSDWCEPCRKNNTELKRIYRNHQELNFEILSIYLDQDTLAWKKAAREDKLRWPQLIAPEGLNSEVARNYQVKSMPANVLVDSLGNLVSWNMTPEELEKWLLNAQTPPAEAQ